MMAKIILSKYTLQIITPFYHTASVGATILFRGFAVHKHITK